MAMPLLTLAVDADLFSAAITGAVTLILGALGAYQGTGHMDLRASISQPYGSPEGGDVRIG